VRIFFLKFVFLFISTLSFAEESLVKSVGEDIKSPWTTPASSYFYIGSAITLGLLILEDQIIDPAQRETVDDKPLGSASKYGDFAGQMIPNIAYAFGFGIHSLINNDSDSARRFRIMAKSTTYSSAVTTILKHTIREPRPCKNCKRDSFPSGHSTTAFAFASAVASEHDWYWGVLAYSIATVVGYSRMNDNRHSLQDVAFGATLGISYGMGIFFRETSTESLSTVQSIEKNSLHILPLPQIRGGAIVYQFSR